MRHLLIALLYSCCYAFVPPLAPQRRRHAIFVPPPSSSSSDCRHSALRATREQAENDGDADNGINLRDKYSNLIENIKRPKNREDSSDWGEN